MTKKKKAKTVTLKLNKDGTMSMRSTGGFDLRKLIPLRNSSKVGECENLSDSYKAPE